MLKKILLPVAIFLLAPITVAAVEPLTDAQVDARLRIVVDNVPRWKANEENIREVLSSTARQIWRYFPQQEKATLKVENQGGPMVLFKRGPKGEYRVLLNTGGTYWAQYAYQFAHELTHILCRYKQSRHPNHWLEEAICEGGSIFAIEQMSKKWQTKPPYPNWRPFSKSLANYSKDLLARAELPAGESFAEWFHKNEKELRKTSTDRPRNRIVAAQILPLLRKNPEDWEAIRWLNAKPAGPQASLDEFLSNWWQACPERRRPFVEKVAKILGKEITK